MRGLVQKCVQSINKQMANLPVTYEVLIADNSSQLEFAFTSDEAGAFKNAKIFIIENKGWVDALNFLFRKAQGELICISHPDIEYCDDCISKLLSFLENHPDAGIIGPNMSYPDGSPNKIRLSFPTVKTESKRLLNTLTHILFRKKFMLDEILWDRQGDADTDTVMSVCMIIRREIIDQIRSIPEAFYMYYANDYICLHANRQGFRNYYIKDADLIHYERFADKKLYSSATQLDYKQTAVPIVDRMERDKFLFLKSLCNWPTYKTFQLLSTLESLIHAAASIKQTRRLSNPVMKKYLESIKAVWRV